MSSKEEKCGSNGCCTHAWEVQCALNKSFEKDGTEKRFFKVKETKNGR